MDTNERMHPGNGLEGISIGPSEIGFVDGENGQLVYRGHDAERLVREHSFEEVAYLLWTGELPTEQETRELRRRVFDAMRRTAGCDQVDAALDPGVLPMDAVRSAMSIWAARRGMEEGGELADAKAALGAIAASVALLGAKRSAVIPGEITEDDTFARAYLRMMNGTEPTDAQVGALDAYLVLTAEHGMNASTFTGRVIVSTASDVGSGLVGAIGALKGKLHGGAPSHVSSMIDEIGTLDNAEPWLRDKIEHGERLMGFGHRVYKTYDPRARALGEVAERLGENDQRLALARHIETTAIRLLDELKPGRRLYTNVEFYAAAVLETIKLDPGLYTPTFAVSRTAGWTAHMLEQIAYPRLIRPQVDYVGPMPE